MKAWQAMDGKGHRSASTARDTYFHRTLAHRTVTLVTIALVVFGAAYLRSSFDQPLGCGSPSILTVILWAACPPLAVVRTRRRGLLGSCTAGSYLWWRHRWLHRPRTHDSCPPGCCFGRLHIRDWSLCVRCQYCD